QRVKKTGVITSLDMAKPDPLSEAGQVDWYQILEGVLPYVDIFLPGLDEILYMLDRKIFESLISEYSEASFMEWIDTKLLDKLADKLINMGTSIIAIKLGNQGLYLRTNANVARLANAVGQGVDFSTWANRQLLAPCFNTNVVGTTGSGDCTIAGVIAGVLSGSNPVTAITTAVGVGACSTETSDATSGVPSLKTVLNRIKSGWQRLDVKIDKQGWKWDEENAVWKGPQDMI
ncbi:MAG: carbohydrate kinase family protein, partial [Deltaproteobacteria bacterium]|nr:carbohydrate kinase family protein [Deltaproteobacteria bacterium]